MPHVESPARPNTQSTVLPLVQKVRLAQLHCPAKRGLVDTTVRCSISLAMQPLMLPVEGLRLAEKEKNQAIPLWPSGDNRLVVKKTFIEVEDDKTPTGLPATYNSDPWHSFGLQGWQIAHQTLEVEKTICGNIKDLERLGACLQRSRWFLPPKN